MGRSAHEGSHETHYMNINKVNVEATGLFDTVFSKDQAPSMEYA